MHIAEVLRIIPDTQITTNESMAKHTSFKIGGPAEVFAQPKTAESCETIIQICRRESIPLTVLGGGSNVLVRDKGIPGVVLHMGAMRGICTNNHMIIAEAGVSLTMLAETACKGGLAGLAFLSGIPGSVGGAVYMNAGAYEKSIADVCETVKIFTAEGFTAYNTQEMGFGYRTSILHGSTDIVISAVFSLQPGDPTAIRKDMQELMEKRKSSQPLEYPSAGSTFKRPPGQYAGKLIMDSGLKGFSIGGAQVSEKHAGFVINTGDATADDVLRLIEHIKETVFKYFNVILEPEIQVIPG